MESVQAFKEAMQTLRYGVAQSLDGYIAPPDESTEWIVHDSAIDFDAIYGSFDAFVMGRKTYEIITGDSDNNPLRGRPKDSVMVVSRTLNPDDHPDVTVLAGGHVEHVRALKASRRLRPGGRGVAIWLMGGGGLAGEFLAAGLLDGIDSAIMPVILGAGFKLMITERGMGVVGQKEQQDGSTSQKYSLTLRSLERLEGSGILMTKYDISYD